MSGDCKEQPHIYYTEYGRKNSRRVLRQSNRKSQREGRTTRKSD